MLDEHTPPSSAGATDRPPSEMQRSIPIAETVLANLLHHAAFAAHLVGHLDDAAHADLIAQLSDHVDAVAHGLTELLGRPREFSERDAAAPRDCPAHDGESMLTSIAGAGS